MKTVFEHNQNVWDKQVAEHNRWTVPVHADLIARARRGDVEVLLTPTKPVPQKWLTPIKGMKVLALASGGGQQVPIFAAAGAEVTSMDLSRAQLEQDRVVAEREGLSIQLVHSNMSERWPFADASFDMIFNPASLCFVPDLQPVWSEAYRALRPNGTLLTGLINPISYGFDFELKNQGVFKLRYPIPYADTTSLSPEERTRFLGDHTPLEFSHTLTSMIQGQIDEGFVLNGFYEDFWGEKDPMDQFFPGFFAIRSLKIAR